MNIYFAGSIRGGRDDVLIYQELVSLLKTKGSLLSDHVADDSLTQMGEQLSVEEIYNRDLLLMDKTDVLVAEVTTPSLGVGYEIAYCIEKEMPVLCLYREQEGKSLSAMIRGCKNVTVMDYSTVEEAKEAIEKFFSDLCMQLE